MDQVARMRLRSTVSGAEMGTAARALARVTGKATGTSMGFGTGRTSAIVMETGVMMAMGSSTSSASRANAGTDAKLLAATRHKKKEALA